MTSGRMMVKNQNVALEDRHGEDFHINIRLVFEDEYVASGGEGWGGGAVRGGTTSERPFN